MSAPQTSHLADDANVDCPTSITFADAQAHERDLLARVAAGEPGPLFSVWRTSQALIVPRGFPSRENYAAAAAEAEASGFPVFERDTGGDLTPQSPGVVNFSLAFRANGTSPNIKQAYERLIAPVIAFLKQDFGVEGYPSAIPGAFCDGAFNIAVAGRKLAGTAQRWKLSGAGGDRIVAALGHVALMCDCDLAPAVDIMNAFYRTCVIDRTIILDRHIQLRDLTAPANAAPDRVALSLANFMDRWLCNPQIG
jgi:lipoate-protein ligase A